ncbi:hypothetical protein ACNEVU_000979 [Escherichia coli]|uniref:hypothetical protein n=1 Tax=Escherichia coli TaxID=562 RepID=UPI000A7DD068|nr:hypothetical protein [Escherichia coli]
MNRSDAPAKQSKPFAINGQREAILPTTPPGDNTASYELGFPPITMILKSAGGLPPKGQDMNQILYELSNLARWSSSGAINYYDAAFSSGIGGYPAGAVLLSNDNLNIYFNKLDANTSDPNSGGAGWVDLKTYLNLQFFQSAPSVAEDSFTRISSPDEGSFLFLKNNGEWGVLNSTGSAIPLPINQGGIGATTPEEGVKNLGLSDSEGRVGRLINVRVITSSGTYTPTAGTKSIVVEVQGAGGAGGAAGLVAGGNIAMGGGGAAGAYARARLTSGFSGLPITIGAKGSGKNPDYSGKSGGATSFGTITAGGGSGGPAVGATPPFIITAVGGATASGGNIVSITGSSSLTGIALSASSVSSGTGGTSPLGSGGGPRSATIAGDNASGFGSGGSGALNLPGATGDLLGGDGSDGVVIVWEYA